MRHVGLVTCALSLASLPVAHAAVEVRETLVHETTTPVEIALNEDTVICSALDYSSPRLKVLIPALAGLTLLDHQNVGAGAPCVAAGECAPFGTAAPADILGEAPGDTVDVTVQAVRLDVVDDTALTCTTSLVERVSLTIRGVPFFHERQADLGERPLSDCVPAQAGGKADAYGSDPADDPSAGPAGCSAAGRPGLAGGLALALAAVVTRSSRRRRAPGRAR